MARRTAPATLALGYDDLSPKAFEQIEGRDFEDFCRELLDIEVGDRHVDAELRGPERAAVPDRGVDIWLEVKHQPKQSAEEYAAEYGLALTGDALGPTVFSCKTGSNLSRGLLRDATKHGARVVEALRAGGRLTIIVNIPLDPDRRGRGKTLREKIAEALWARTGGGADPSLADIASRVRFIDAHQLKLYLQRRRPLEVRASFRHALGIHGFESLGTLEEWRDVHREERARKEPVFASDPLRDRALDEIRRTLSTVSDDPYDRILWLFGPPGVGKTRLAIEALSGDETLQRRTLVATDVQRAVDALEKQDLLGRFPSALLVVDDCPPFEVERLVLSFKTRAKSIASHRSALLLVTPQTRDLPPGSHEARTAGRLEHAIPLEPMDAAAQRRLIALELGPAADPSHVERIARLTEGYPWFAVLVAREIRAHPDAPIETAAQAADYALASRNEAKTQSWKDLVIERAKCLLLAMLTEDTDWDSLSDTEKEDLCRAVGLDSWRQVSDRLARECVDRGILRMRLGRTFKYITPAILAREVVLKLLRPRPDGGGPEPRGPAIWRHARRFAPAFYERLEQLEIGLEQGPDVLGELAAGVVDEIRARSADLRAFDRGGVPAAALRFAAHHRPAELATLLRQIVESTSLDALRAWKGRRDLVFALESLARRRDGFDDAEAALFRLALAENESFVNNATGVWKSLFLIELNPTYRTFEERLGLLRERCRTGDATARLLALGGLGAALATRTIRHGEEQRDGPWAMPTRAQARTARLDAWRLLVELARDGDASIATAACAMIAGDLRGAVRAGLAAEVAELVLPVIVCFPEAELSKLRESIAEVDAYDPAWIVASPRTVDAWSALARAAAPGSFAERLRQAVRTWGPARRGGEDVLDEALARELLDRVEEIAPTLDWLETEEAVRSAPFVRALGRVDRERKLLEPLLERARRGARSAAGTLALYLLGWKEAGHEADVDALLRAQRGDPRLAPTTALVVFRLGATDERIGWLIADLQAGHLPDGVLDGLVFGAWAGASDAAFEALVDALLGQRSSSADTVALWLLVNPARKYPGNAGKWRASLRRALQGVAEGGLGGLTEHVWEQGVEQLVAAGDVTTALDLTMRVMRARPEHGGSFGWEVLQACAARDPAATWVAVAPLLEGEFRDAYAWALDLRFYGVADMLPAREILAWVGRSTERAALAVELCRVHQEVLSPLARGLLSRFGPDGPVARALAARAHATPRVVTSLAESTAEQARLARVWATDVDPRVRRWAERLLGDLERSHEHHSAYEEHERRRWGT